MPPFRYAEAMAWGQDAGTLVEITRLLARLPRDYDAAALPALLARWPAGPLRYPRQWREIERLGRLTGLAAAYLPLATQFGVCFKRALVRYALLRQRGLPVTFHLGLRPGGAAPNGHAWLELHGEPLWERGGVTGFRETFRYPSRAGG
jgi:hypothetical protein